MNRHALIFWSAILLAAFGLVYSIIDSDWGALSELIIPVLLIAVIYYFFKKRAFSGSPRGSKIKVKPSQKTMAKVAGIRKSQASPGKRKSYPFQVIEGSKGKNDDHLPKYH
ncbi:hypothetical protein [Paenibacillus agri]|uniref:Uncharacterized protein n=1 Tax=Paenibacillus agri TaxID=2744309 RepID=A0A850EN76_9BACL|nr:hypothetical protein [Paenibacillus agri]NUU62578.1 hypothetical protein [Paenibacillus agri]